MINRLVPMILVAMMMVIISVMNAIAAPVSSVNAELKASLSAFFAASPTAHGAKAELIRIQTWPNIQGAARWSLPNMRYLPARISLIAEQGQGKSLRRWYVAAQVKWMAKVVVLNQDVSARTMLDRSMMHSKNKNIAGLRGDSWQHISDVIGMKTLRSMRNGEVIVSSLVKRPPLIKRGDSISILAEVGGIRVRAEGIALKSGSRGDRLPVQNIRSKQTLQSIVRDAHTVSVEQASFRGGV